MIVLSPCIVSKSNIAKDKVFVDYKKYIDLCGDIDKDLIKEYQDRFKNYTGAKDDQNPFLILQQDSQVMKLYVLYNR